MPRSSSGVYSLPQPAFVAGTTILSASVNSDLSDIATTLTQSVATTGVSTMTGPLKAFAGASDAPSYTYASDLTTGEFLSSAGVVTGVCAGTSIYTKSTAGITMLSGNFIDVGGLIVRGRMPGELIFWPGTDTTAPNGTIFAAGQDISRTTYADVFSAYGTQYGVGDGSTTFGVPDFRGRSPLGRDDMNASAANRITTAGCGIDGITLGAAGGAQNHILTTAECPSGLITLNDPQHSHSYDTPVSTGQGNGAGSAIEGAHAASTTGSSSTGITLTDNGSDDAHLNVQPSIVVNVLIYTGVFT